MRQREVQTNREPRLSSIKVHCCMFDHCEDLRYEALLRSAFQFHGLAEGPAQGIIWN